MTQDWVEIGMFCRLFARCRAPGDEEKQSQIVSRLLDEGVKFEFQDMLKTIRDYGSSTRGKIDELCMRDARARKLREPITAAVQDEKMTLAVLEAICKTEGYNSWKDTKYTS